MVLNFTDLEINLQWKWFFRPRQRDGMTVEDYYAQFCNWKEEMISTSFPAKEEDYVEGFIENLKWDIRWRSSKYKSSRIGLKMAFHNAKFEESMMQLEAYSHTTVVVNQAESVPIATEDIGVDDGDSSAHEKGPELASCNHSDLISETTNEHNSDEEFEVNGLQDSNGIPGNDSTNSDVVPDIEEYKVSESAIYSHSSVSKGFKVLSIYYAHMAPKWNNILEMRPKQSTDMSVEVYYDLFYSWKKKLDVVNYIGGEESYIDDFIHGLEINLGMKVWAYKWKPRTLYGAFRRAEIEEIMMKNDPDKVFVEMSKPVLEEGLLGIEFTKATHYMLVERLAAPDHSAEYLYGTMDYLTSFPCTPQISSGVNGSEWVSGALTNLSKMSTQYLSYEDDILEVSVANSPSLSKLGFNPQVFDPGTLSLIKPEDYESQLSGDEDQLPCLSRVLFPVAFSHKSDDIGYSKDADTNIVSDISSSKVMFCETVVLTFDPGISSLHLTGCAHFNSNKMPRSSAVTLWFPIVMFCFNPYGCCLSYNDCDHLEFNIDLYVDQLDITEVSEAITSSNLGVEVLGTIVLTLRIGFALCHVPANEYYAISFCEILGKDSLSLRPVSSFASYKNIRNKLLCLASDYLNQDVQILVFISDRAIFFDKVISCWILSSDRWTERVDLASSSGTWLYFLSPWKANFAWDPGICAISVHILEDKDVFKRVGKGIVLMEHKTELIFTVLILTNHREDHLGAITLQQAGDIAYAFARSLQLGFTTKYSETIKEESILSFSLQTLYPRHNQYSLWSKFGWVRTSAVLPSWCVMESEVAEYITLEVKGDAHHILTEDMYAQQVKSTVLVRSERKIQDCPSFGLENFIWDPGLCGILHHNGYIHTTLSKFGCISVMVAFKKMLNTLNLMQPWACHWDGRKNLNFAAANGRGNFRHDFVWNPVCHFTTLRTRRLLRGRICHESIIKLYKLGPLVFVTSSTTLLCYYVILFG